MLLLGRSATKTLPEGTVSRRVAEGIEIEFAGYRATNRYKSIIVNILCVFSRGLHAGYCSPRRAKICFQFPVWVHECCQCFQCCRLLLFLLGRKQTKTRRANGPLGLRGLKRKKPEVSRNVRDLGRRRLGCQFAFGPPSQQSLLLGATDCDAAGNGRRTN